MDTPNLLIICFISFSAVLLILSSLALIMKLLLFVFPVKIEDNDSAVIAAINVAYNRQFPGTRVIKIGEQKWYLQKSPKKLE